MTNGWQAVQLGEVLRRAKAELAIDDSVTYKQVTVRLWNKGVILRGKQKGITIKTKRQFYVKTGQLLMSRIDVRNGAIGLVPKELDGAIVSNDFWAYDFDENKLLPKLLAYYVTTPSFIEDANRTSSGTTQRIRADESAFLNIKIPLPPLDEQRRIVAHVDMLTTRLTSISQLRVAQSTEIQSLLVSTFNKITENARWLPMREVAPQVRRPIKIDASADYPELGVRSFGRGTFHKPAISGVMLGTKRLFRIEPNDFIFNNVFAWEGAVAVAKNEDADRFGSHRFITCLPIDKLATSEFLCFYFLTREGLEKLGTASPGGAGRNRTLGLNALENILVPVPEYEKQIWFDSVQARLASLRELQSAAGEELGTLLPSVLNKAFKGEL